MTFLDLVLAAGYPVCVAAGVLIMHIRHQRYRAARRAELAAVQAQLTDRDPVAINAKCARRVQELETLLGRLQVSLVSGQLLIMLDGADRLSPKLRARFEEAGHVPLPLVVRDLRILS